MTDIERGQKRWKIFLNKYKQFSSINDKFRCLDLGCGRGEFVLAGILGKHNVYGVDVNARGLEGFRKLIASEGIKTESDRCILYDGDYIPFPSDFFSAIHSWYVLEHVTRLEVVLREMVRVTRPGGHIILNAQDARTGYEGHARIPWIPFLPRHLIAAWLSEFGKSDHLHYIQDHVYYITTNQVVAVLEHLGCEILHSSGAPNPLVQNYVNVYEKDQIREIAQNVINQFPSGDYPLPEDDIYIVARKSKYLS